MTKELTFKEALILYLQGEKVEAINPDNEVLDFNGRFGGTSLSVLATKGAFSNWKFRLAPKKILVNGVEVPAPEKVAPVEGTEYYVPDIYADKWTYKYTYRAESDLHKRMLERGLVYLNEEDCIARAKAMLITKEV